MTQRDDSSRQHHAATPDHQGQRPWGAGDEPRREPFGAAFGTPYRATQPQPHANSWTSASTYRHPGDGPAPRPDAGAAPSWSGPATATTWAQPPAERRRSPGWGATIVIALAASLLTSGGTLLATDALAPDTAGASTSVSGDRNVTSADPIVTSTTTDPDWANVAAAVGPSVVSIQVLTNGGGGEGSGFVYDDAGHVVTNNHVVEGATDGGITVTLSDGQMLKATIAGTDPATDIAVLTLEAPPAHLTPVTFGDSEEVLVGDPVVAIGNPLGLSSTVTTGIVSALDRPVSADDEANPNRGVVTNAIQVDASINPGNSGGPLFDATGRVIGVTSSIATLSQSSGSVGLGFAIPGNLVQRVAPQLIESGRAEHAYLGVSMNDGAATVDGVTRTGARVVRVEPGTPAAQAGLQADDVIVEMDGKAVSGSEALTGYVREHASGDQVTLRYVRAGQPTEVTVTLATRPDNL